jgi:hypothetical protein
VARRSTFVHERRRAPWSALARRAVFHHRDGDACGTCLRDRTFAPGIPTEATYQFNSWRRATAIDSTPACAGAPGSDSRCCATPRSNRQQAAPQRRPMSLVPCCT